MPDKKCLIRTVPVLLAGVLLCFLGTLEAGFVSDDFVLVHRVITEGYYSGWGGETGSAFFRPVISISYMFDSMVWGSNPWGFHLTNILWHLLSGTVAFFLFFVLLKHLPIKKPCLYAVLSSVLFLTLASHSESVARVSGRTDIIATTMCLLSLLFFYRQLEKPSVLYSLLALFLFLTGLLAKESVIVTPLLWVLLLAYYTASNKVNLHKKLVLPVISALVAAGYIGLRMVLMGNLLADYKQSSFSDISFMTLFENLVRYSFRVFLPPLPPGLRGVVTEIPILVPLFLFILAVPAGFLVYRKASLKQKRLLLLMAGFFFVSLLPVLGMKVSLFSSQSERFLYLPGVFAAAFITTAVITLFGERKITLILLVSTIVFQGIFLYRSNRNWVQAGRLCSAISESVAEYNADSIYILAVPDSFHGAYVFRNGLNEAVAMLTGEESNYTVLCRTDSYGDSLFSEQTGRINLHETDRQVISFVNGSMQRIVP